MKISRRAAPLVAAAYWPVAGPGTGGRYGWQHAVGAVGAPFAGILLSIALMPLLAPIFWHHHFGKVAAAWALAFCCRLRSPLARAAGVSLVHALWPNTSVRDPAHRAVHRGGRHLHPGNLHGGPGLNTAILAIGAVLASVHGHHGGVHAAHSPADPRQRQPQAWAHVVVFFIFIVSNAGGSLTPLGDPPLFLGFLKGVDFFWTVRHIFPETLFLIGALLAIFFVMDSWYYHRREEVLKADPTPDTKADRL